MGKKGVHLNLAGIDLSNKTRDELVSVFKEILDDGIHGISFSAYIDDQCPGDIISDDQIRKRMQIIKPHAEWIRSFSCTDGNEKIPRIAHEMGLKSIVGVWLGDDKEKNEKEIENAIKVAQSGYADIVAVGNEVMLRGDLSLDELLAYINRVKKELPDIAVSYVDAYYEFTLYPQLVDVCDVLLANCYPFWEGCSLEYSLIYLKDMYARAVRAAKGKKVIISETGWPNKGEAAWGAVPSYEGALKYFIDIYTWAAEEDIDVVYFASFDEDWKVRAEGDVGAYWGLWDKDDNLKFDHGSKNYLNDK